MKSVAIIGSGPSAIYLLKNMLLGLENASNQIEEISIYDMKGMQIKNFKPESSNSNTMIIPVYQLQTGVYLLSIKNTNGKVYKERFIVK